MPVVPSEDDIRFSLHGYRTCLCSTLNYHAIFSDTSDPLRQVLRKRHAGIHDGIHGNITWALFIRNVQRLGCYATLLRVSP